MMEFFKDIIFTLEDRLRCWVNLFCIDVSIDNRKHRNMHPRHKRYRLTVVHGQCDASGIRDTCSSGLVAGIYRFSRPAFGELASSYPAASPSPSIPYITPRHSLSFLFFILPADLNQAVLSRISRSCISFLHSILYIHSLQLLTTVAIFRCLSHNHPYLSLITIPIKPLDTKVSKALNLSNAVRRSSPRPRGHRLSTDSNWHSTILLDRLPSDFRDLSYQRHILSQAGSDC